MNFNAVQGHIVKCGKTLIIASHILPWICDAYMPSLEHFGDLHVFRSSGTRFWWAKEAHFMAGQWIAACAVFSFSLDFQAAKSVLLVKLLL